ncbi:MAG: leucine-rich repeat protein [Treponema sp.]|jgi:peptidoglycan hydrolase-like protein with peptidoglycan-binding domain|nr:leucine-rich repeat protein [Treponema sp.]
MSEKAQKKPGGRLWLLGFLIILFCLSGAVGGLITSLAFDSSDEEPVGTIVASNNVVQRRTANQEIWERLTVGSPIYEGDTIRTADLSSTTLYIDRNSIDLNEKTFIRIQRSQEDEDAVLIYLDERSLGFTEIGEADGYYGPMTETVIKNIQASIGFESDGKVNRNLLTYIFDDSNASSLRNISNVGNTVVADNKQIAQSASHFLYATENSGITITGYTGELTDVIIPASINGLPVVAIGDRAFSYNQLTSISLPGALTFIGPLAFYGNPLTSEVIPDSIRTLYDNSFDTWYLK